MLPSLLQLPLSIQAQPTETTCGPTCLHAVYRYLGSGATLPEVVARTRSLRHGGTFAVFLACDALMQGYAATIYTFNMTVFDPSWFRQRVDIAQKLQAQRQLKRDRRLVYATDGYLEFLRLGGNLRFTDLSPPLVRGILRRRLPIITGLSSTFLYRARREFGTLDMPDDVRGTPSGHFVVISGYNRRERTLLVADPYGPDPAAPERNYWIRMDRVFNSVLLGIVTHDANLLIVAPRRTGAPRPSPEDAP
jgi:hypothetical protein